MGASASGSGVLSSADCGPNSARGARGGPWGGDYGLARGGPELGCAVVVWTHPAGEPVETCLLPGHLLVGDVLALRAGLVVPAVARLLYVYDL